MQSAPGSSTREEDATRGGASAEVGDSRECEVLIRRDETTLSEATEGGDQSREVDDVNGRGSEGSDVKGEAS